MASRIAAAPPLSDLSREIEELRRQLASVNDAQLASEVSQHHQTVLSNIMLPGQVSGEIEPESLDGTGSGVAKAAAVNPVSKAQNGADNNSSNDAQADQPSFAPEQIPAGSDLISHHSLTPNPDNQILTPLLQTRPTLPKMPREPSIPLPPPTRMRVRR